MVAMHCPACGTELPDDAPSCPKCRLSGSLFEVVREAAGPLTTTDPASVRTIGEILATVDLSTPAVPTAARTDAVLSRSSRFPAMPGPETVPEVEEPVPVARIETLGEYPQLPAGSSEKELDRRIEEYFQLGRRFGLDFTDFEQRNSAAHLVGDWNSVESVAREMFVHLISVIAEEFEAALARRNELAALAPTPSPDVELEAIRQAIAIADLPGAQRRLAHVRDELQRSEEEWAVGRILVTEGELLASTVRELGGDPAPALGPFEEGRRLVRIGRRTDGERLLARGAVALWAVLEPRLLDDLHKLRDRLIEIRSGGADIEPAVGEIRSVLTELRQRNFVGTIVAYRRVRSFVEQHAPAGEVPDPSADMVGALRPSPSL
ncbi:MAG TPA: zinc ribbon domain-containing protein [Thermoplasmata archaeon]|nr:zinc ribbon domain-containing protein [Thermoplasmata archaeon]